MTRHLRRVCNCCLALLMLLLTACGGGGSKKDDAALVDPAPAYQGVQSRATVNTANAEDLAMSGYAGGGIGSAVVMPRRVAKGGASGLWHAQPVQHLATVVKKSLRRMEIPQLAKQRGKMLQSNRSNRSVPRAQTLTINGTDGGSAFVNIDINDSDRTFSGTITYNAYASGGVALTGNSRVMGTFNPSTDDFTRFTTTFEQLTARFGGNEMTLIGTLSWGGNYPENSDTLSTNLVVIDNGKSYWFRNYEIAHQYAGTSLTRTISGRYYDPDQGYVDFTTATPLVVYYGNSWPSQGDIRYSGGSGTSINLRFNASNIVINADCDGNGSFEWQTEIYTNGEPDNNVRPVANAGPDGNVSQGATVTLDGSASTDADGDTLSYYWEFQSCPNNACPSLSNPNSATPSFVADNTGTYSARLTVNDGQASSVPDTVTVTSTAVEPSEPALVQQQWQYGVFGGSIGDAGLLTSDLDGDGAPEIIASASGGGYGANSSWYVLRRSTNGDYEQLWRSEQYASALVRMILADLTGDGKDDVVLGLADGKVLVYSGTTLQEVKAVTTTASLTALAIADLEGDGAKEIVTSNGTGVYVYSANTGALRWSLASGGGSSIALGNVDDDPAKEIVTTTYGGKGYVIDSISRTVSWEYIDSFGAKVALGDLDGDSRQEIVGASSWYKITVFEADRKTPVWEVMADLDIDQLLVADADGDGVLEIVYGDGQWGEIHGIDVQTRSEKWKVHNPEHSVSGLAVADVDLDGKKELLWGAGGHLFVADRSTGTIEWQNKRINGPLSAVAVGDVDDDGEDEILMVSRESDGGYGEGMIHIFNARTHALEYQEKLGIMDWMGVRSVRIGDVDGDGKTEFVVTTGDIYDGVIRVYDGATRALKRQSAGYDGNFFSALAIGDVDGDGKAEIVAGQGREHTGARGNYLIVFDGATLQEKWRSVDLGGGWSGVYDIKLADLDGDGHKEIAVSTSERLMVYGADHSLKLLAQSPASALEVANVDSDVFLELLLGRADGKIEVRDGNTLEVQQTVTSFGNDPIHGLRLADLADDGSAEWLVASGGFLKILDGQGGLKWKSRNLSGNLGDYNHIGVLDADRDGKKEIYLGADIAIYQFE